MTIFKNEIRFFKYYGDYGMKHKYLILPVFVLLLYACSVNSKSASTTVNTLEPGEAEVKAIQERYTGVSLQTLKDGYAIYTGPCAKCHRKKKIYSKSEEEWSKILNKMAPKSKLTSEQKDALWKYIVAMKATHSSPK